MMGVPAVNSNTEMVQRNRFSFLFQSMVTKHRPVFFRQLHLIYLRMLRRQMDLMCLIWDAFEHVMRI